MVVGKLSVKQIEAARPSSDGKEYLLGDGGGLHLRVRPGGPHGKKSWVGKYTDPAGIRRKMGLGVYPDVGLAQAREAAMGLRQLVTAGKDPKLDKIEKRVAARKRSLDTFEKVAREWHAHAAGLKNWSEGHAHKIIRMLEIHVFPKIGKLPIGYITPADISGLLFNVSVATRQTAGEIRSNIARIYKRAVTTQVITAAENFMAPGCADMELSEHLTAPSAARIGEDLGRVGQLMRDIRGYKGHMITVCCLMFMPLVFQRPGQVRHMEWSQIDLDRGIWTCPPSIMKMTKTRKEWVHTLDHIVPLSRQAVDILRRLHRVTGPDGLVFKSVARRPGRPLSENTVNVALDSMGYATARGGEISGHGFRALARTLLREKLKWDREEIERHLAHKSDEELGDTYDRTRFIEQRRQMSQVWADWLDDLRDNRPRPDLALVAAA